MEERVNQGLNTEIFDEMQRSIRTAQISNSGTDRERMNNLICKLL